LRIFEILHLDLPLFEFNELKTINLMIFRGRMRWLVIPHQIRNVAVKVFRGWRFSKKIFEMTRLLYYKNLFLKILTRTLTATF
jgi:hypothetical protein